MYKIEYNNLTIYDAINPELKILSGNASLEVNKAGSLTFVLPAKHKYTKRIERLKHIIKLFDDDECIFQGRILDFGFDFQNNQKIYCEGELAYLNDSVQEPFEFRGDIPVFLQKLIDKHNEQVDEHKKFKLGIVTVTDENQLIVRESKEYINTLTIIRQKLLDMLGGYIIIRHESDGAYIDYLKNIEKLGNQKVQYGINLMDVSREVAGYEIATAILPLGAEDSETGERITVEKINGKKYIIDEEAVQKYGLIIKTEIWDDVTLASNLMIKAKKKLAEWVRLGVNIEISAADLSPLEKNIKRYKIGDRIRIISTHHNIDDTYMINHLDINLLNPAENNLQIGDKSTTLTEYQANKNSKFETVHSIASSAQSEIKEIEKKTQSFNDVVAEITSKIIALEKSKENLSDLQKAEIEKKLEEERAKLEALMQNRDKIIKDELEGKMTENFNLLKGEYEREIEESANGIRDTLKERYYTKDESKTLISEEGISKFTSKDEFEIAYSRFLQDIEAIQSGTAAEFLKIRKYLHFDENGITIGETGTGKSNFSLKIDNNKIKFIDNGAEIAYWENSKFYAVNGEFINSLKLGNFAFIPRQNGNLSFIKVVN